MIKWEVDISKIQGAVLERAKVEAARKQAELIEEQNKILETISGGLEILNRHVEKLP